MKVLFSRQYVAYVVFVLFLANVANYGQRVLVSILLPSIKADVALSDQQLGILMGGVFALFYAAAGVPLSRLADRNVRRSFLASSLALWSAATALFGFTSTFAQMLVARIALGVGQSVCIPCSHSLLTDYVAPENRPLTFGLHSSGAVVGATLSLMLGGYLDATVGWRYTLVLMAIPGVLLAIVIIGSIREPARQSAAGTLTDVAQVPLIDVIRHLMSLKSYVFVLTAICFAMLVEYGVSQWLPSYYVRRFGLSVSEVGWQYGVAIALGGIPGSVLGGLLANRLLRKDIRWLVWMPALAYAVAIPVGLCMLLASSVKLALLLNGLHAFAVFATNGAFWSACFLLVPPMMRATTSAITLMAAGVIGLALGPVLVGGISDALVSRIGERSLQMSLVYVECLGFAVIVVLVIAGYFLPREAAKHRDIPSPARADVAPLST